jgi:hypothetical protein
MAESRPSERGERTRHGVGAGKRSAQFGGAPESQSAPLPKLVEGVDWPEEGGGRVGEAGAGA